MGGQSWLGGGAGRSGVTSSEFGRGGVVTRFPLVVSVGPPFAGDVARRFVAVEKLTSGRDDPVDTGI